MYSNWAEVHIRADKDGVTDKDASETIYIQPEALKHNLTHQFGLRVSTKVQKHQRDKTKDRKRKQESRKRERGNVTRR